jgi:hypothetical protein
MPLYAQLRDIDAEIEKLFAQRKEITRKIARMDELAVMRVRGNFFHEKISEVMRQKDPVKSLHDTNTKLAAWRQNLPRMHFPRTLEVMPESYPSNWTAQRAFQFFECLVQALKEDMAALEE